MIRTFSVLNSRAKDSRICQGTAELGFTARSCIANICRENPATVVRKTPLGNFTLYKLFVTVLRARSSTPFGMLLKFYLSGQRRSYHGTIGQGVDPLSHFLSSLGLHNYILITI